MDRDRLNWFDITSCSINFPQHAQGRGGDTEFFPYLIYV